MTVSHANNDGQMVSYARWNRHTELILKRFAVNSLSLTLARGLAFGSRALALLVLARIATAQEVANAAIAVTVAETARLIGDLGVEVWLVRTVGQARNAEEALPAIQSAFAVRLGVAVVASVFAWLACIAWHIPASLTGASVLLTVTGMVIGVPVAVLQARLQLDRLLFSLIPLLAAGLVAVVSLVPLYASPGSMALWILSGFEVAAVYAAMMQSGLARFWKFRFSCEQIRKLLRSCFSVAIYNAIVGAYSRLDVWLLASLSATSLATYTVGFRLYQPFGLVMAAIGGVSFASFARAMSDAKSDAAVMSRRFLLAVSSLSIVLGGVLILGGTCIVELFFSNYQGAKRVLYPLAAMVPIMGVSGVLVAVLTAEGRFGSLCKAAAFNLLVFAVALSKLIPAYGASGASMGLLFGESCNLVVLIWLVRPWRALRIS